MIFGRTFPVHLGVVVEEVGVDFVQDPGTLENDRLHEDEEGGRDPIDEGARGPLMGEGQVQELEHLEERAEAVHEPMLIVLRDTSTQIDIVQDGGYYRQDHVGISFI